MRRVALASVAALAVSSVLVVAAPVPALAAPDGDGCVGLNDVVDPPRTDKEPPTEPSAPLEAMQVADAQAFARRRAGGAPGAGVQIAVVDSGVRNPDITVSGPRAAPAPIFFHGTAVAGVIAGKEQPGDVGPVGIAPGATIYDARVFDTTVADDGDLLSTDSLVEGLEALRPLVGSGKDKIRIVTISLTVDKDTPALEAAVEALTDKGAIVVAASGDRESETDPEPTDDEDEDDTTYESGENVTKWPAGYSRTNPRVVSVGTTTDPADQVRPAGLLSSSIDVVVPTYGAVSYTIDGSTCSYYQSSTSIAAAEVSGVLALLATVYPNDNPLQLIARLEVTATGNAAASNGAVDRYRGRGIVQPVEALTRPLRPDDRGVVASGAQQPPAVAPAALPESQPDVLRSTRRNAVWWGLFGGGALVVALLLRPVLSRRRTR